MLFRKRKRRLVDCINYQPLPWIGLYKSRRADGTISRWKFMDEYIEKNSSVLDIGCDVGYFVFKSAEKNCLSWGIESSLECHLIANYAREKTKMYNTGFFYYSIDVDDVCRLPDFDYIIFLSVFHHWCAHSGFKRSKEALAQLIAKSRKAFFFEMGQEEVDARYNVPSMGDNPQQWISDFLGEIGQRPVRLLGQSEVFVNKGEKKAWRYLFCVGQT